MGTHPRTWQLLLPLCLTAGCASIDPSTYPVTHDDAYPVLAELDAQIVEEMAQSKVPGLAACIVKDAAVVWCAAYGWANVEDEVPATVDTPFMWASVSKAVSSVVVMTVEEDGDLDLDTAINDYLPFTVVHPDDPLTAITSRQLMAHTSGIVDNWDELEPLYVYGQDSPLALGDFMEGYLTPGGAYYDLYNWLENGVEAEYEYCNVGAALAAYVIEPVTGQSFADYSRDNLFEPLGMEDTAWLQADLQGVDLAMPYFWSGGEWDPVGLVGFPDYPNGQLRAGARAMGRFVAMFAGGGALDGTRILSEATVAEMSELQFPDLADDQALAWYYFDVGGDQVLGHNGGEEGVSSEIGIRQRDGVGFAVVMNGEGNGRTLANIEEALFEAAADL